MTTYRRSLFGGTKEGLEKGGGVGRLPSPASLKEEQWNLNKRQNVK